MASGSRRVELTVYDVPGLFRQAFLSCKSSIPLLLTLALISAVYETAVERSSFLSGISLSAHNSNFSFQMSSDPKQQVKTPQNHRNNDVPEEPRMVFEGNSLMSRIMATFLPDKSSIKVVDDSETALEGPRSGLVGSDPNMAVDSDANSKIAFLLENTKDTVAESEELKLGIEGPKENMEGLGEAADSGGQRKIFDEQTSFGNHEANKIESTSDDREGNKVSLADEELEDNEEEGDHDLSLPRVRIQAHSNETKKPTQEFLTETMDLTFLTGKLLGGRGLDQGAMPRGGSTVLLMFLVFAGALTIFLAAVGFQQSAVLGSIAYSVVSTHMGKRASIITAIRSGFKSGIWRLMWLAILHATLQGLQSLFFMKTLFSGVMEIEQAEQLVLRLSATPFAFLAPFRDVDATDIGMATRIGLFVGFDYIFDGIAYCLYVVACWVTIMERNLWGLGALSRSWNLVKRMEAQALVVRVLEVMVCGRSSHWLIQQAMGPFPATFVICTAQAFFLVLWLIFYISARSICDGPSQFSYGTLEDFLDRFK